MNGINRLLNAAGFVGSLFLALLLFAFPGFLVLILLIVPITWLWAKLTDQSYNSLIDSSGMLYKLNKFGQIAWIFFICISISFLILGIFVSSYR